MNEKVIELQSKSVNSCGAEGSLISEVIYLSAKCHIYGGRTFEGSAWGLTIPGGGSLFGEVYLTDGIIVDDLYQRTEGFMFTATPIYTAFFFLIKMARCLGIFRRVRYQQY